MGRPGRQLPVRGIMGVGGGCNGMWKVPAARRPPTRQLSPSDWKNRAVSFPTSFLSDVGGMGIAEGCRGCRGCRVQGYGMGGGSLLLLLSMSHIGRQHFPWTFSDPVIRVLSVGGAAVRCERWRI